MNERISTEVAPSIQTDWTWDDHRYGFNLSSEFCPVCDRHRKELDGVRYEMLAELQGVVEGLNIAPPWSPEEEWNRLLEVLKNSQMGQL